MQNTILEQIQKHSNFNVKKKGVISRSVKLERYKTLGTNEKLLLKNLDKFEAPYLQEKLLKEKILTSTEEYQEAFKEFKKYIALVGIYHKKLAMTSKAVDNIWHQFILFTRQYCKFCGDFLGFYLHHVPKTSYTPLNKENEKEFTKLYKETYTQVNKLWNIKPNCSSRNSGCSSSGMCGSSDCSGGG